MTTNKINMIDVIKEAREAGDHLDRIADYGYTCTSYICDIISEIADSATSIYYRDIIKFISENVEAVNDAIAEFGWDGCGADLYKAGQMAEYLQIEQEFYNNFDEMKQLYAADYIRNNYGEEIDAAAWEAILDGLDDIDNNNIISDIDEMIDGILNPDNDSDAEKE